MADLPDWTTWLLAAAVIALFAWFFWHTVTSLLAYARKLIDTVQNWPQTRRAMVDAEAGNGGRYPLWYRMVRVGLILALIALLALFAWRRFN